jgi:levanase
VRDDSLAVTDRRVLLASAPQALSITATLEPGSASAVGFSVFRGDGEETKIGYDTTRGELFVDRTASGEVAFSREFPARHAIAIRLESGALRMRVLVDYQSVEVFAGDGRAVLTAQVFPMSGRQGLDAWAVGGSAKLVDLDVRGLAR